MDGPSYGYSLKGEFEAAVGPQWGPLNIGHLYQILDRLSRDEFVTSHRVAQSIKPDRVVYEITDAGRAELARWLESPTPRTSGYRDDFSLKVMAAARGRSAEVVREVITAQRGFLLHELRNLETLRRRPGVDLVAGLLMAAATQHVNADLAFSRPGRGDPPRRRRSGAGLLGPTRGAGPELGRVSRRLTPPGGRGRRR